MKKYQEIRKLSLDELKAKNQEERITLQKLIFAHAISPIENPMKIKYTRRLIAKLETALNNKAYAE